MKQNSSVVAAKNSRGNVQWRSATQGGPLGRDRRAGPAEGCRCAWGGVCSDARRGGTDSE